jgi:hypothetical protein
MCLNDLLRLVDEATMTNIINTVDISDTVTPSFSFAMLFLVNTAPCPIHSKLMIHLLTHIEKHLETDIVATQLFLALSKISIIKVCFMKNIQDSTPKFSFK